MLTPRRYDVKTQTAGGIHQTEPEVTVRKVDGASGG